MYLLKFHVKDFLFLSLIMMVLSVYAYALTYHEDLWEIKLLTFSPQQKMKFIERELQNPMRDDLACMLNFELAKLYQMAGKYQDALKSAQASNKLWPNFYARKLIEEIKSTSLPRDKALTEFAEMDYDYESAFLVLEEQLKNNPEHKLKIRLLYGMANLYKNIGDLAEAFRYIGEAMSVYKKRRGMARKDRAYDDILNLYHELDEEINILPTLLEPIRELNKEYGLSASLDLGIEYDTNVILQEINPSLPTDKKDGSFLNSLNLSKDWVYKIGNEVNHGSSYSFNRSKYFENESFDSTVHTFTENFSHEMRLKGKRFSLNQAFSLTHFSSAGERLLWSWSANPSIYYYDLKHNSIYNASLNFQKTKYYQSAFSTLAGFSSQVDLNWTKFLQKKLESLTLSLSQVEERPQDSSLHYGETSVTLSGVLNIHKIWLPILTPTFRYYFRQYKNNPATNLKRRDDQYSFSLSMDKSFFKKHRVLFTFKILENDSNNSSNHYLKQSYTFNYIVKL